MTTIQSFSTSSATVLRRARRHARGAPGIGGAILPVLGAVALLGLALLLAVPASADPLTYQDGTTHASIGVDQNRPLPVMETPPQDATISRGHVTCGTTATRLPDTSGYHGVRVRAPNSATAAVWVGDANVTAGASSGAVDLIAGQGAAYMLPNANQLYCRVASGTSELVYEVIQ